MSEYDKIADRATHTPEPWQLFPHGKIGNADDAGVVAYLATFETEWKANGNLIIAAPDLLAACELFMIGHDDCCDACRAGYWAIAKARGSV